VAEHCKTQEELALHDALTGLPNRRLLEDRLQTALKHATRKGLPLALLYLDLDGFKLVNDTYGHDCGDKLLKEIARRLVRTCRSEDTVARMGGDEFVIVLSDIHDSGPVRRLAGDLVRTLSQPCAIDGHEVRVSASIGIAFYPDHADTVEDLINSADRALYLAKGSGKNQYQFAETLLDRPRGRGREAARAMHIARTVGTS
jgi:diguanylate cyclase (GGDEF)-like protein